MTVKRLPNRIRNQINLMILLGADVNVIKDWLENKGHQRTLKRCYEYINDCLRAGLGEWKRAARDREKWVELVSDFSTANF